MFQLLFHPYKHLPRIRSRNDRVLLVDVVPGELAGVSGGKPVPTAADGENHLRIARGVTQLVAEVGDVHVDGAGDQAARVQVPDVLEDLVSRDGSVGVGGKVTEELDFPDGEFIPLAVVVADFRPIEINYARREIDASHSGK